MKCTRAQDMFSAYLENAVEPPLRVAFEQHLAECPQCKADYERFNAAVMMLEELPEVDAPASFHAAVMTRVEQEKQVVPHKVRWWNLDWQRVFTIRVPARAAAMGFAVVLLMVMLFQLTPASTVVADWFGIPRVVNSSVGGDSSDAPRLAQSNIAQTDLGLEVSVKPLAGAVYELRIQTSQEEPIKFSAYSLADDATRIDSADGAYQTAFIRKGEVSTMRVDASGSGNARVMVAKWIYRGKDYSRFVFLPPNFDPAASGKSLQVSIEHTSMYNALKTISQAYGVVILATGDLSRNVNYAGVDSGTPEEVLYKSVMQAKMRWQAIDSSVYTVEPGD